MTIIRFAIAAALLMSPVAALAGASGFSIVNQSGSPLSGLSLRRTGSSDWHPLGAGLSPGASSKYSFTDPDCAFDIKATLAGSGEAVWRGVNLCEVASVTLQRDATGATWVDYD
ncbi:MAG: hypothetical protein ABIR51_08100 [Sphingomicrobium sp.]